MTYQVKELWNITGKEVVEFALPEVSMNLPKLPEILLFDIHNEKKNLHGTRLLLFSLIMKYYCG